MSSKLLNLDLERQRARAGGTKITNCEHNLFLRLQLSSDSDTNDNSTPNYFAIEEQRLWSNAKVIKYCFVKGTSTTKDEVIPYSTSDVDLLAKMDYVTGAMRVYEKYANIKFELTDEPDYSDIRISFDGGSTSCWSTIGTDALLVPSSKATTDLGVIDPKINGDVINAAIALHAVGHMLGLFHEVGSANTSDKSDPNDPRDGHGISNLREFDKDSIMRYFEHTNRNGSVSCDVNQSLSDNDKAWLSLHYPKSELNRPVDADTWTYKKSLGQLLGTDADYQAFLESGDVAERRSLYYEFIHKAWKVPPSGKKCLADATFDKNIITSVKSALDNYQKDPNGWVDFIAEDRTLWDSHNVNSAPKPVPARMVDGKSLDAIQIQNSLFDLLRLLGRPPAPAVQHFLTYRPEDPLFAKWLDSLRRRQRVLEDQMGEATGEEKQHIEDELESIVELLAGDKTPEQVKALAEAGLDGLLQSMEKSIPEGADVTAADIQQFFPWIPIIVGGIQILRPILGFSIDADGKMVLPEDVQQAIWGDIWGGIKKVPWEDVVDLAAKIIKSL